MLYLLRERGYSPEALERLCERESGLVALGGSADMATLLRAESHDLSASLAIRTFAYSIKKAIGAYAAALGGVELLVFTGGIGEHAARVRELICEDLSALGIELAAENNRTNSPVISTEQSRCRVRIVPTNEALVIARQTHALAHDAPRDGSRSS
jgi:acetate kinase